VNPRWYIAFVVVALAFIGISVEQPVAHNQEIVVQFNAATNAPQEAEKAVAAVKTQLQRIGVHDVQITATFEGTLKITYFSNAEVSAVKALFSAHEQLEFGYTDFSTDPLTPSNSDHTSTNGYELKVSEIPTHSDNGLGLNGTRIEFKSVHDRYLHPIVFLHAAETLFETNKVVQNNAVACYTDTALLTDTTSYKIPEVRAGPVA
jgi:hypothetical protein|tara:strand:- start:9954 stop:10568 length:615 start_codon:yes stop_codon:yes gene_type:complete